MLLKLLPESAYITCRCYNYEGKALGIILHDLRDKKLMKRKETKKRNIHICLYINIHAITESMLEAQKKKNENK